jgi:hypothetical protein
MEVVDMAIVDVASLIVVVEVVPLLEASIARILASNAATLVASVASVVVAVLVASVGNVVVAALVAGVAIVVVEVLVASVGSVVVAVLVASVGSVVVLVLVASVGGKFVACKTETVCLPIELDVRTSLPSFFGSPSLGTTQAGMTPA